MNLLSTPFLSLALSCSLALVSLATPQVTLANGPQTTQVLAGGEMPPVCELEAGLCQNMPPEEIAAAQLALDYAAAFSDYANGTTSRAGARGRMLTDTNKLGEWPFAPLGLGVAVHDLEPVIDALLEDVACGQLSAAAATQVLHQVAVDSFFEVPIVPPFVTAEGDLELQCGEIVIVIIIIIGDDGPGECPTDPEPEEPGECPTDPEPEDELPTCPT